MSQQHCAAEDRFFLTPCIDLNSIKSGMTLKSIHDDNLSDPLNTLVFNFSSLKGNHLYIVPFTVVPFVKASSCSKVPDGSRVKVAEQTYAWWKTPAVWWHP